MVGTFHDDQLDGAPPKRGTSRILPILRFLRSRRAEGTTSLQDSMRKFTARYHRPGVVYPAERPYTIRPGSNVPFDALRYARHLVHVVHLLAPREAAPQLHGDVTLLDSETGAQLDLTVTPGAPPTNRARDRNGSSPHCTLLSNSSTDLSPSTCRLLIRANRFFRSSVRQVKTAVRGPEP